MGVCRDMREGIGRDMGEGIGRDMGRGRGYGGDTQADRNKQTNTHTHSQLTDRILCI